MRRTSPIPTSSSGPAASRLSNFLLWQAAYSELVFTPVLLAGLSIARRSKPRSRNIAAASAVRRALPPRPDLLNVGPSLAGVVGAAISAAARDLVGVMAPLRDRRRLARRLPFVRSGRSRPAIVLWEWARLVNGRRQPPRILRAGWSRDCSMPVRCCCADPAAARSALGIRRIAVPVRDRLGDRYRGLFRRPRARGPKLWAAVSPEKHGQARVGGALGGVSAALLVSRSRDLLIAPMLVLVAWPVDRSQAGDLLESAIKRQFGAKDASSSFRAMAADGPARRVFDSGSRRRHGGIAARRASMARPRLACLVI
jgi:hypothetical protein